MTFSPKYEKSSPAIAGLSSVTTSFMQVSFFALFLITSFISLLLTTGGKSLLNVKSIVVYPIHSPKFIADEDALPIGSAILSQTAVDYLDTYNN